MTLEEIHGLLHKAYTDILSLHGALDDLAGDTAFALGEAAGTLAKAKALVGRDIDQRATK